MQSKSLLIAIAAFAVTATGVQAYGGTKMMSRAGLSPEQAKAFAVARELRQAGDPERARNTLIKAGITEAHLQSLHRVTIESRDAIREAVERQDYQAFQVAAVGSPLSDIVTSEADFRQFCQAQKLQLGGWWSTAGSLKAGSEVAKEEVGEGQYRSRAVSHTPYLSDLTSAQREALAVARQANDRDTIQAILAEAGVSDRHHHKR